MSGVAHRKTVCVFGSEEDSQGSKPSASIARRGSRKPTLKATSDDGASASGLSVAGIYEGTHDMSLDRTKGTFWINIDDSLVEYDTDIREVSRVKTPYAQTAVGLCVDTKRDHLVMCNYVSLLCVDNRGSKVREIQVPKGKALSGVDYCAEKDLYLVGDTRSGCVWYIKAEKGAVDKGAKIKGKEKDLLQSPWYISHVCAPKGGGTCHVFASDRFTNCVHMFDIGGGFVRRFGSGGPEHGQIDQPFGVCATAEGRVFLCDSGNKRIVSYGWGDAAGAAQKVKGQGDIYEGWVTAVGKEELAGHWPRCVVVTARGEVYSLTIKNRTGFIQKFT